MGQCNEDNREARWRFELFYFDYSLGVLLASVFAAFTFGMMGSDMNFQDRMLVAGHLKEGYALAGGVVFNLANMLLVAAIDLAGLAVAFPVGIGLALIIGVVWNYVIEPRGNPTLLFAGLALVVGAIIVDAWAHFARDKAKGVPQRRSTARRGVIVSIVSGVLMGAFYPIVEKGMGGDLGLGPYAAALFFALGVFLSTFLFNPVFMNVPIAGPRVKWKSYFLGLPKWHFLGIAGGAVWAVGAITNFVAASAPARECRSGDQLGDWAMCHSDQRVVGFAVVEGVCRNGHASEGADCGNVAVVCRRADAAVTRTHYLLSSYGPLSMYRHFQNATSRWTICISLTALLLFVGVGIALLRKAGTQSDEVMFVYDLWHPQSAASAVTLFGHSMPLMLMSYLGALKSWLYAPIFYLAGASPLSLRVPVILLSAITMTIGALVVSHAGGRFAGVLFVWLLATDSTFLLTSVFDWGPSVLQNLFLVSGGLAIVKWWSSRKLWMLYLGSLIFGLALWDKALFIWNLSAIVTALAVVNLRAIIAACRPELLAVAALGLCLGAWPLLYFNLASGRSTLGENTKLILSGVGLKGEYLVTALDGVAAETEWCDGKFQTVPPKHSLVTLSSWRFPFLLVGIALGVWFSQGDLRRWIVFLTFSAGLAWFQSAITVGAGGSMHHAVLIWPFLYGALALSFGAVLNKEGRLVLPVTLLLAAIICLRGVEAMNAMMQNLSSYSRTIPWTDADIPLRNLLVNTGVERVITVDWGIADVIAFRTADLVSVVDESFELSDGRFDKDRFLNCNGQGCAVIAHVEQRSLFKPAQAFLHEQMRSMSLVERQPEVISDSHGSPAFVVFRIGKQGEK